MKNERTHTIKLSDRELVDMLHVCTAYSKVLESGVSFPEITEVLYRIAGLRHRFTDELLSPNNDNNVPPEAA